MVGPFRVQACDMLPGAIGGRVPNRSRWRRGTEVGDYDSLILHAGNLTEAKASRVGTLGLPVRLEGRPVAPARTDAG
jgi:hypothetical protein